MMVLFTVREMIDLLIMTGALGYVFMAYIEQPRSLAGYLQASSRWKDFRFALMVTAPAVVLHELMHKFAALLMGLAATFHASYFGLGIGVLLRLFHSPFIIFMPGYVSITAAEPLQSALTAFMGPFTNLILFGIATVVIKNAKKLRRQQLLFWHLTKQINLFLFLFNMIPIPPFDGSHVVSGIAQTLF